MALCRPQVFFIWLLVNDNKIVDIFSLEIYHSAFYFFFTVWTFLWVLLSWVVINVDLESQLIKIRLICLVVSGLSDVEFLRMPRFLALLYRLVFL